MTVRLFSLKNQNQHTLFTYLFTSLIFFIHSTMHSQVNGRVNGCRTGTNDHICLSANDLTNELRGAVVARYRSRSNPNPTLPHGLQAVSRPLPHSGCPVITGRPFGSAIADLCDLSRDPSTPDPTVEAPEFDNIMKNMLPESPAELLRNLRDPGPSNSKRK